MTSSMTSIVLVISVVSVVMVAHAAAPPVSLHGIVANTIHGQELAMGNYAGKLLLIVNVASECGYTQRHYDQLNVLHKRYASRGLTILAFPCNQFGRQEPGTATQIQQFCQRKGVDFEVFDKIDVNGVNRHPLYQWLLAHSSSHADIAWNFEKFLVDFTPSSGRDATVIGRYASRVDPFELESRIIPILDKITHATDEDTARTRAASIHEL